METRYPSYRRLLASGEFQVRVESSYARLSSCNLCPRNCGIDRTHGQIGTCKGELLPRVSSCGPHFGEEAPLVGQNGSGAIFLTGCNLRCCFCQNYEISHHLQGKEIPPEELALMMLRLEEIGCHNINLVTPTHFVPQIMEAVLVAAGDGLSLPLVYNCGGYESIDTLKSLDGIVDIYMPDFKFWCETSSQQYCNAPDYPSVARQAIREMHRQVGDLVIRDGLAIRGLLVRHLVMPGHLDQSKEILDFLAREISSDTFVNVMDQYRPCYHADQFPGIARRLRGDQFDKALDLGARAGLRRIYT
jgi:putative pyruvate formate lyase activating enzyme